MSEAAKKWEPKIPDYKNQKPVNVGEVSEEYRKKLIEGSEGYQAGKAAKEVIDGISKASEEEIKAMEESMKKKLDEFKSVENNLNTSYKNLLKEIDSGDLDFNNIEKLSTEAETIGENLLTSINKYLGELPELKKSELIDIRKEMSNLYLDTGNTLEGVKRDSFSVLGKRKAAAV